MTTPPDRASPVAERMLAALPPGEHEDFEITALDRIGLPVHTASLYPAPTGGPDGVLDAPARDLPPARVAAHTAHHVTLDDVVTAEDVEREVLAPLRRIGEVTGRTPPAQVFRYGRPHDASSPAWQAAAAAGVPYALSNTAVERIR